MAIQLSYTDPVTLVVLPVAYVRVMGIHIEAIPATIEVRLGIYASAAARQAGGIPPFTYSAWPPFNAITQGPIDIVVSSYNYVKSLPIFNSAIDVL